jgi:hypothetical protein
MEIEQRIYQGDRAREVLENEAFGAAFADIKQEITEQWKQSPARDHEGREKLWQLLKLADKLEATLRSALETGQLAKLDLQHQRTLAERAKAALGLT